MKIDYHAVNLTIRPAEREIIEAELERVASALRAFKTPAAHVEIERSARKGGIGVSLHVSLPTRSLFATAWGGNLRGAIELATDKVVRQAKRHVDVLRKEERAGAESVRTTDLPRVPTAAELESARDFEEFSDQAAHHVARLNEILKRERRLDPRALAAGGRISIPDIVEDALVYVFEHFHERPLHLSPDRWFVRRGLLCFEEELERVAADVEAGSDTPTPAPEAQEDWEELLEIPLFSPRPLEARPADDRRASPELLRDRREAQRATAAALKALPDRERRAVLLRHLERYQVPEIAYVLNATEEQIADWLLQAETTLQNRLKSWKPS